MFSDVYHGRIIELLKSGVATPEQLNTIAECVLIASCEDSPDEKERAGIKLLEDAIGFTAQQEKLWAEEDARAALRPRTAGSKKEGLAAIARRIEAGELRAQQAGDRRWRGTLRRLKIDGGRGSTTCSSAARSLRQR